MSTDLSSITTPHSTLQTHATSILSFSEGSLETIEPSPCTAPCGVAAYHAAGIGPTPSLCDKEETAFISAYENCAACIRANGGSWEGILKPELQQALAYCDIDLDSEFGSAGEDNSSTKSADESTDGGGSSSSSSSSAEESGAEETSEPSGAAEGGESEGNDGGDEDDDSSGNHLAVFGPLLGGIAGILHFILI